MSSVWSAFNSSFYQQLENSIVWILDNLIGLDCHCSQLYLWWLHLFWDHVQDCKWWFFFKLKFTFSMKFIQFNIDNGPAVTTQIKWKEGHHVWTVSQHIKPISTYRKYRMYLTFLRLIHDFINVKYAFIYKLFKMFQFATISVIILI